MIAQTYWYVAPEKLFGTNNMDWIEANDFRPAEIHGYGGTDYLFGGDIFGDTLYGDDGSDFVYGRGGNDLLVGGNGNDALNGGDGNDTLRGGWGTDTLLGGAGDDNFLFDLRQDVYYRPEWTRDEIRDFQSGHDHIAIVTGGLARNFREHSGGSTFDGYVGLTFDASANMLYYDGTEGRLQLAHLNGAMTASDVVWV